MLSEVEEGAVSLGITVPRVAVLDPKRPPEMLRVTPPVGGGVPEPLTVTSRVPKHLGKLKPACQTLPYANCLMALAHLKGIYQKVQQAHVLR